MIQDKQTEEEDSEEERRIEQWFERFCQRYETKMQAIAEERERRKSKDKLG